MNASMNTSDLIIEPTSDGWQCYSAEYSGAPENRADLRSTEPIGYGPTRDEAHRDYLEKLNDENNVEIDSEAGQ